MSCMTSLWHGQSEPPFLTLSASLPLTFIFVKGQERQPWRKPYSICGQLQGRFWCTNMVAVAARLLLPPRSVDTIRYDTIQKSVEAVREKEVKLRGYTSKDTAVCFRQTLRRRRRRPWRLYRSCRSATMSLREHSQSPVMTSRCRDCPTVDDEEPAVYRRRRRRLERTNASDDRTTLETRSSTTFRCLSLQTVGKPRAAWVIDY